MVSAVTSEVLLSKDKVSYRYSKGFSMSQCGNFLNSPWLDSLQCTTMK